MNLGARLVPLAVVVAISCHDRAAAERAADDERRRADAAEREELQRKLHRAEESAASPIEERIDLEMTPDERAEVQRALDEAERRAAKKPSSAKPCRCAPADPLCSCD